MQISGNTRIIAHIGFPTHSFRAPMIYNPYFEQAGIDAVVVPMGCPAQHFESFLRAVFTLSNICGALITMPHKVSAVELLDEASPAVRICGACNAIRRTADGRLVGDMFDGEGFVRGVRRKGIDPAGKRVLIVGAGGVGSAIAAAFGAARVAHLALFDTRPEVAEDLAARLREQWPILHLSTGSRDPAGFDIVVNATPLGMEAGDALPIDMSRLAPSCFVGEVVMRDEMTAFLHAARERGCGYQVGSDMLFEQIPAYLEFFGLPTTTPENLRAVARLPDSMGTR
jgi:shikimate dehydrogenase